jgi:hypothetical protein
VRQTPALRLAGASLRPMRDVPYTSVRARSPVMLAGVYRQVAPHDEQGAGCKNEAHGNTEKAHRKKNRAWASKK